MKNYIYRHRIVSAIVVCVLIVVFSTLYFSFIGQNPPAQDQTSPFPIHTRVAINTPVTSIPTVTLGTTQTYSGNTYQISYPQTWTEDTMTVDQTQGRLLSLQPDVKNPSENAHVAVEINSTQDASIANISDGLTFLGFHKSYTSVQGISAQKFTGMVTLSQKMLHNTIYLFSYNNQIYLIKLSYQGSADDPLLEQEFIQTVDTMRFN